MENVNKEDLETQKIKAEIGKMLAETRKLQGESLYYPIVVGSGATMLVIAFAKLFV